MHSNKLIWPCLFLEIMKRQNNKGIYSFSKQHALPVLPVCSLTQMSYKLQPKYVAFLKWCFTITSSKMDINS